MPYFKLFILTINVVFGDMKKMYIKISLWLQYIYWSLVYALLRNSSSLREFEGVPKLTNDIPAKGNRPARLIGIVYGSKMTKG